MNRFKIAGAALLMFAVAFGASAQTENAPVCKEKKECAELACKDGKKCDRKMREGNRCAGMFEGIDLTPEQQAQIDQLMSECKERGEATRQEKKAANLEQRKNERAELQAKVEKILTPEQYAIFRGNMDKKLARPMRGAQGLKCAQKEGCDLKAECKKEICANGEGLKAECAKADCKKGDCTKADCKKGECTKADCKKGECTKADCKKGECTKADCKKGECVKADCKKDDCKKGDCKKGDCKKGECTKADCKKGDCRKADCKKGDCKKADCKKK